MGHLGARVSALLDGQLPQAEADEAWAHVYACHACRDLVEREGWVKTRLAGLSCGGVGAASPDLKGSLLNLPPGERFLVEGRGNGAPFVVVSVWRSSAAVRWERRWSACWPLVSRRAPVPPATAGPRLPA